MVGFWGKLARAIGFGRPGMVCGGLVGVAAAMVGAVGLVLGAERSVDRLPQAKNVILMVADGCGIEAYTLARWMKGKQLAVDELEVALVRTHSANSVITDSAAAATAYATGRRTANGFVGVGATGKVLSVLEPPPEEMAYRPLATVLEGAKLLGKATGVVVTCRVTHATPAAFLAHVPSRTDEQNIMLQMVHQNADVVLGGGREWLRPTAAGGKRTDGRDLTEVLKARGYQMPKTRQELAQIHTGRVFGLFAEGHLAPEIDRPRVAPDEPSLEEMTRKAIQLLKKDPDGFFLMVEGSQIDWACHANDPAYLVGEMLMFDRAVAAAVEFARQDGQTLLIVVSDHATGGLSIGNAGPLSKGNVPVEAVVEPLRRMKCSFSALWRKLDSQLTIERLQEVLQQDWGIEVNGEEAAKLLAEAKRGPQHLLAALCERYTLIGWTTRSHTGGDVVAWTLGPGRPQGVVSSAQLGHSIALALGLDIQKLNARLFADPTQVLPGVKVEVVSAQGKAPQTVCIRYGSKVVNLALQTNLLTEGTRTVELEGLCLYGGQTKRVYVPMEVLRILGGEKVSLPKIRRLEIQAN